LRRGITPSCQIATSVHLAVVTIATHVASGGLERHRPSTLKRSTVETMPPMMRQLT